jgi:putative ABC transport system ATP-binding protein
MSTDGFIQTDQLTRVYSSGVAEVKALRDVTLSLGRGRFVGITGASGSGKSTLMNLVGGLDTPSSGSIRVAGRRISDLAGNDLALFRLQTVGMIFQSFNLVPSYTALDNVVLPLLFAGMARPRRQQRGLELLGTVGLDQRSGHRPAELSGGEQQRVAIARALVNGPQVLLADEPTGNLDSRTSRQIMDLLADLNGRQDLTILMISHQEDLLREYSHEVIALRDGAVSSHEVLR